MENYVFAVMSSSLSFPLFCGKVADERGLHALISMAGPSRSGAWYLRSQFFHTHRLPLEERNSTTL